MVAVPVSFARQLTEPASEEGMSSSQILAEQRIRAIDRFVANVRDAYKNEKVGRNEVVSTIGHQIEAIDKHSETEVGQFPEN